MPRPAPLTVADITGAACTSRAPDLIQLGTHYATTDQVFVATMDGSGGDGGAPPVVAQRWTDRIALRCNQGTPTDGIHYFTLPPGVHTIDNKLVQAGRTAGVLNNQFIFFPQAFAATPVVLMLTDGSPQPTTLSLINVLQQGFQVTLAHPAAQTVNWIAFTPGDYTHGALHFRAGTFPRPANCPNNICTSNFLPALPVSPGVVATPFDNNNDGAQGLYTINMGVSATQYQWFLNQGVDFVQYVAFWNDK